MGDTLRLQDWGGDSAVAGDLCLRVEKGYAEQARKTMIRQNLYDRSRKILAGEEMVLIPILRPPVPEELLGLEVARFDIGPSQLKPAENRPKDIREFLEKAVPQPLLPLLPKSYDLIGDLVVLEYLPAELATYKAEIGEALLHLNPSAKTVLLKTGKVKGEYRVPKLEVVAGEERFSTIHTEYGLRLKVDLSKVYFSPRLGFERYRVATSVQDGETIVDMFAGVGPFSLMIAKNRRAKVYAIDINPYAVGLIRENLRENRLIGEVIPICGDIRTVAGQLVGVADHIVMNLPGTSLDFLDVASSILKREGGMAHIYLFTPQEPLAQAKKSFREAVDGIFAQHKIIASRIVKEVAPRRWQVALDVWAKKGES